MSSKNPVNIAASVLAKLRNLAAQRGWNYTHMLTRYGIERFLFRLGISEYAKQFVLKGGNMFVIWQNGNNSRPTIDSDLLCYGDVSDEHLKQVFAELCNMTGIPDDGVVFDSASIRISPIRETTEYGGTRIVFNTFIGTVRFPLQFDIGVGGAVTPAPEYTDFPVLLQTMKSPRLWVYPMATAIAEKASAMVALGLNNSRMKDFYDIWLLSRMAEHDYQTLATAVRNTFERSRIPMPSSPPVVWKSEFGSNPVKHTQWAAFLNRNPMLDVPADFNEVVACVAQFLTPLFFPADSKPTKWIPGQGWIM